MIIQVKLGTNGERITKTVDSSKTIKSVLEENDINYSATVMHMDGAPLGPGDVNKTFDDFGITDSTYLLAVVKASNAR